MLEGTQKIGNLRTLYWVGAFPDDFGNMGDVAHTHAAEQLLNEQFSDYRIVRCNRDKVNSFLKTKVKPDDLIFIHSGGDWGDIYYYWHRTRKQIIEHCKSNFVVQLPVTIHYDESTHIEADSSFFQGRNNLLVLCRTSEDLEIARKLGCNAQFFPDLAFNLKPPPQTENRRGMLAAMRFDVESKHRRQAPKQLRWLVRGPIRWSLDYLFKLEYMKKLQKIFTGWVIGDINRSTDNLTKHLKKIQRYQIVISDRLHVCVFCYLTKTPFIALQSRIPYKTQVNRHLNYENYFKNFRKTIEEEKRKCLNQIKEKPEKSI
jgi:pyruvyl transferase EpsI